MYRFPLSSTAAESTPDSWSCTAGIPSVLFPVPPCPATVVIVPDGSTLRTRPFVIRDVHISGCIQSHTDGTIKLCLLGRPAVAAKTRVAISCHRRDVSARGELPHSVVLPVCNVYIPICVGRQTDRKSTRLNSSHLGISYAVF